jgi:hypothetical protein
MSTTLLSAILILAPMAPALPSPAPRVAGAHIRTLTPGAAELLREAERRSTVVAALRRSIEATDAIVYLSDAMPVARQGARSHLQFLSLDSTVRYLLVWVDVTRLSPTERIVALGHELFHALEVAAAPEVKDGKSFVALFKRIGWETSVGRFETDGAREISERIFRFLDRIDVAALVLPGRPEVPTPRGS